MSIRLAPIDLTGAVVGTTAQIDFTQFVKVSGFNPALPAQISLLNESGCGVNVVFQASGNTTYLPAGAWGTFPLAQNDGTIAITVTYVLPGPPVSVLNAVYYAPGEPVPANYTLGNSPIGGTTTVGGVAESVQNDGNPITRFIEATVLGGINPAIQMRNDGIVSFGNRTGESGQLNIFGALGVINVDNGITVGNPQTIDLIGTTGEITAQSLQLAVGSTLIGISFFTNYTSAISPTNYNHNLGTTPSLVMCQPRGGVTTSRTINVNPVNFTSTTFEATCNAAGFAFDGIALKF